MSEPRAVPNRTAKQPARPIAFRNARLIDPASGFDERGGLLVIDGVIADMGSGVGDGGLG